VLRPNWLWTRYPPRSALLLLLLHIAAFASPKRGLPFLFVFRARKSCSFSQPPSLASFPSPLPPRCMRPSLLFCFPYAAGRPILATFLRRLSRSSPPPSSWRPACRLVLLEFQPLGSSYACFFSFPLRFAFPLSSVLIDCLPPSLCVLLFFELYVRDVCAILAPSGLFLVLMSSFFLFPLRVGSFSPLLRLSVSLLSPPFSPLSCRLFFQSLLSGPPCLCQFEIVVDFYWKGLPEGTPPPRFSITFVRYSVRSSLYRGILRSHARLTFDTARIVPFLVTPSQGSFYAQIGSRFSLRSLFGLSRKFALLDVIALSAAFFYQDLARERTFVFSTGSIVFSYHAGLSRSPSRGYVIWSFFL